MLPNQPPPSRPKTPFFDMSPSKSNYTGIINRNIFDSEGKIPEALGKTGEDSSAAKENQIPVLSSLPLILQGTIVHSNSKKSIASIEIKSKSTVMPFRIGEDIENIATLLEIERGKIIFRNKNSDRKEFLEMNLTGVKLSSIVSKTPIEVGANDVLQTAPNHFEIKRTDLTKYLSDLSSILQQAAKAPRKNVNGDIECFKFLAIQPGSIYTKLGFQNGDCIKAVNGEKIDSPAKAMETYMALKNSADIKLQFERDGKDIESNYQVK